MKNGISEIINEYKNETTILRTTAKEKTRKNIKKPEYNEYQEKYTLKKAIEKNYLPSKATLQDINEEVIKKLILGGDFCIYNKDGSVDMYFDAPK